MVHVGMDLHTNTAYIRALTDDGTEIPGRRIHLSHLDSLWEYLDRFEEQRVRVAFEAVGNSRWMHRLLSQRPQTTPVAVSPRKVKIIGETLFKTDKIDAGKLAWLSRMDSLPEAWIPDERIEDLREVVRHRARLVRIRTRAKNEITGMLVRCGLQRPFRDIFGALGLKWLRGLKLRTTMRLQRDNWLEEIELAQRKISSLDSRLRRMLGDDPDWAADRDLLLTIPGLGIISAATILGELGNYRRFHSRSQVASYAGLVPRSHRSEKTKRYGKLTKAGPSELRRVLTQVALGVARKVPRYWWTYDHVQRKKCANVAKSAIARRIVEDAWTLLIKREPFRADAEPAGSLTRAG